MIHGMGRTNEASLAVFCHVFRLDRRSTNTVICMKGPQEPSYQIITSLSTNLSVDYIRANTILKSP